MMALLLSMECRQNVLYENEGAWLLGKGNFAFCQLCPFTQIIPLAGTGEACVGGAGIGGAGLGVVVCTCRGWYLIGIG